MKLFIDGEERSATPEEAAEILAAQAAARQSNQQTNTKLREVPNTLFGGPTMKELINVN